MGLLIALALFLIPLQQPPTPPATGTLQVRVFRASTQETVGDAQVLLFAGASEPAANVSDELRRRPNQPQNSAITATDGRYTFRSLAPGRYTVQVQRDGYFGPVTNGNPSSAVSKSVTVESGKTVNENFALVKGGVIFGRIRNPDGQLQSENRVVASRQGYSSGRSVFVPTASAASNDRGEYRIYYLPPGEYFISATPFLSEVALASSLPDVKESEQDAWTSVFYPETTDPAQALPIRVGEGQEIGGIDLKFQTASVPRYRITGRIANLPSTGTSTAGVLPPRLVLSLMPRELGPLENPPATFGMIQQAMESPPAPEFRIFNVRPGLYDLSVFVQEATTAGVQSAASIPIEIRKEDVSGLSLVLSPGVPLTGVIVDDDNVLGANKSILRIRLAEAATTPQVLTSRIGAFIVDAKGAVSARVPAGHYSVTVAGLPPDAYVSDVRYGANSVFDDGIDIEPQPQPFKVVIRGAGATVQGTVVSKDRPMANVTVVLVPESRRQNSALYKTAITDDNGTFTIRGAAPGMYTILAWQDVISGAWQNTEFLDKYRAQGKRVIASAQSTVQLQLEMIP